MKMEKFIEVFLIFCYFSLDEVQLLFVVSIFLFLVYDSIKYRTIDEMIHTVIFENENKNRTEK